MTYHGLGLYEGFEVQANNPVAGKIIERQGGTSSADLEVYGQVSGTIAGAAACAAGGPVLAAACGWLGGKLGGIIAKAIPIAKGSGYDELVTDTWNKLRIQVARKAKDAHLAVMAYLVMRDKTLADMANVMQGTAPRAQLLAWGDQVLRDRGALAARDVWQWRPDAQTYTDFQRVVAVAEGRAAPNREDAEVLKQGIDPRLYYYPEGPPTPEGSALSWYRVGGGYCHSLPAIECHPVPNSRYPACTYPPLPPQCQKHLSAQDSINTANQFMGILRKQDLNTEARAKFVRVSTRTLPNRIPWGWILIGLGAAGGGYWLHKRKTG